MINKFSRKVGIEEDIKSMFSGRHEAEGEIENRITRMIEEVYASSRISSNIQVEEIAGYADDNCIPDNPIEAGDYFDEYIEEIIQHSINVSSPNFIGHMTSALPYFVRPLSRILVALNQNVVKLETSKFFTLQERQVIAMLHNLTYKNSREFYEQYSQNSQSTLGVVTSGGTLANLTALWIARNNKFRSKGIDVVREGVISATIKSGYKRGVIIASSLVHYSVEKAVDVLGIGTDGLIKVDVDDRGRMDIDQLQSTVKKCKENGDAIFCIIGIGGATETGAIDPLEEIARIAHENEVHFHVDAAWGGPLLFSEKHSAMLKGIEKADTVTIDGHKQLYLPVGIGLMLCKNPELANCIEKQSPYIIRKNSSDIGRRTLEGSRPAMALLLHAGLHLLGKAGYSYLIDEGIKKTRYMAEFIRNHPAFELIAEPEINILNYRYIPVCYRDKIKSGCLCQDEMETINDFNEKIQDIQSKSGQYFVSRTKLSCYKRFERPISVFRAVVANPLTTEENIQSVVNNQLEIAEKLEKEVLLQKIGC